MAATSARAKLTDAQLVVLSRAAQRDDGALVAPDRLKGAAVRRLGASLTGKGLVRETIAKPGMPVWRSDEDGQRHALVLTASGRAAIHVNEGDAPDVNVAQHQSKSRGVPTRRTPGASPQRPSVSTPHRRGSRRIATTESADADSRQPRPAGIAKPPRDGSKLHAVLALLWRENGASITDVMQATGWLPQTARAALTGLRQRGYRIERVAQENGPSSYRIVPTPAGQRAA